MQLSVSVFPKFSFLTVYTYDHSLWQLLEQFFQCKKLGMAVGRIRSVVKARTRSSLAIEDFLLAVDLLKGRCLILPYHFDYCPQATGLKMIDFQGSHADLI